MQNSDQLDMVALLKAKKTRPLIKWTGGKYEEYSMFAKYIPGFNNYYEPFFGGGGVFFAAQPSNHSFLNDKSRDLIAFYSLISSGTFRHELLIYADAWDDARALAHDLFEWLMPVFHKFLQNRMSKDMMVQQVQDAVLQKVENHHSILFHESFIVQPEVFKKKLAHSIADKINRIARIVAKEKRQFSPAELEDHLETGVKSGLYLFLRSITNKVATGKMELPKEKAVANWYFVREFCYASMFRFNAKGEFNIPYGGIAYNKKDFRQKVKNIFRNEIKQLFAKATFYNEDFETFLHKTNPQKDDFIFVDPPYDSEFSEYDQNSFTRHDQERLRDVLIATKAKWMMVIKETDFIRNLYSRHCRIIEFDKTYTYNVRGRNNRDTKHLIILNYDP